MPRIGMQCMAHALHAQADPSISIIHVLGRFFVRPAAPNGGPVGSPKGLHFPSLPLAPRSQTAGRRGSQN